MSIQLNKSHQNAGIHLQKQGVDPANLPHIRVGLCLDTSGSMSDEYQDGHVQDALTHVLALAMHMDKSHRLDVFTFDDDATQCRFPATPENYETFVRKHILEDDQVSKWGATEYAPPIHLCYQHYYPDLPHLHSKEAAHQHVQSLAHHHSHSGGMFSRLFGHKQPEVETPPPAPVLPNPDDHQPTVIFFFTDGECFDKHESQVAIHAATGLPLFWVFVGLAHQSRFLEDLGREPDAEFVLLEEGIRISDDRLYQSIITPKLAQWVKNGGRP